MREAMRIREQLVPQRRAAERVHVFEVGVLLARRGC